MDPKVFHSVNQAFSESSIYFGCTREYFCYISVTLWQEIPLPLNPSDGRPSLETTGDSLNDFLTTSLTV